MELRAYQQTSIDGLYGWWQKHPAITDCPLLVLPTGAGKSVVIAELVRLLFDTWPESHPRTVVLVPSKELAEQNADKLMRILPSHIRVGYYSASLGRKQPDADVIVATIGSIAKNAHLLGNIRCVVIDEAHLVNPDGAGQYRQFLNDLARYCVFRVVGFTATPFRGNGVWLTDGDDPLFTGIAHETPVSDLLQAGYLSPLIRPIDAIRSRIDTSGISTSNGDYNIGQLSDRVSDYLPAAADEACQLAADRHKWIAFLPTVTNAEAFAELLNQRGIPTLVVCGDTPKKEREQRIASFRHGEVRCLVTVLALATGFDVPDVDCIIWLRPTQSPVLYVQGAGRGLRIAEGKQNCLWVDFSDTTERLGPVDGIRGRKRGRKKLEAVAPFAVCGECGNQVRPASSLECPDCGATLREPEPEEARAASNAAIMAHQVQPKINTYPIDRVSYARHQKPGSPDSLRAEYWCGLRIVAREWVCLDHQGFARAKAERWWAARNPEGFGFVPGSVDQAFEWLDDGFELRKPESITINESGKYPEIVNYQWEPEHEPHAA